MTEKMEAALRVLAGTERAMTPNEIGAHMGVDPRPGAQYRSRGPGSIIAPVLTSLERRGLIYGTRREDGLSGSAYAITDAGMAEARRSEPQRQP